MTEYRVRFSPEKYVKLFRATTDKINVAVGLHQGSALSPYLVLLSMDALIMLIGEDGIEVQPL